MYKQRLNIFILLCVLCVGVCGVRLCYLQIFKSQYYRRQIEINSLNAPKQLPTVRGTIVDRNGKDIAIDKPAFYLEMKYELTRLLDDRYWRGRILEKVDTNGGMSLEQAELDLREELSKEYLDLLEIIDKSAQIKNVSASGIDEKIRQANDSIWRMREFFAWWREYPESDIRKKYKAMGRAVTFSAAIEDLKKHIPDEDQRIRLIRTVDLAVMHQALPLVELANDKELLEAQLAFVDIDGVQISPEGKRTYPYGSAGCQLIGWVATAQEDEKELFADDNYSRYLSNEIAGKDGVERVCEVILRGRRGEVIYDRDGNMVEQFARESQFGQDVELSLDIELQAKIENYLSNAPLPLKGNGATGAVVIEVATGDILALVSTPIYNLNTVRSKYKEISKAEGNPFGNKALYELYPAGSTIKPVILIAGLEEGKITSDEVISCPCQSAPRGWPNCITRKFYKCHDSQWQNTARNAIRGSCNVFFSRLADRIDSETLQEWLFNFGYGRKILSGPDVRGRVIFNREKGIDRNLRQSAGQISSDIPKGDATELSDLPTLDASEKRMFGIGQGGMRVTVLQVANAMATIARGGIFKNPRLFLSDSDVNNEKQQNLNVSEHTLSVIRDGMKAVTSETDGSAYTVFRDSILNSRNVTVYGKTGSTEAPEHAWFAGFTEDTAGRAIAIAIVVEEGQSGSRDAAPLAEKILTLCNERGYIGTMPEAVAQTRSTKHEILNKL